MITVQKKIRRVYELPPKVLICRLQERMKRIWKTHTIKIHPVCISDRAFIEILGHEHASKLIEGRLPIFHVDVDKKDDIILIIKDNYQNDAMEEAKLEADTICNHIFDLLGSGKTELGAEIDWHKDFKSSFRWNPKEYFLGTEKHVNLADSSDVKVPWELSRCQHFATLGKAYWYTGKEKYAAEFVSEVESWIKHNPIELGVNWACTMDVAIRAVNWIWGYYFFCRSETLTRDFRIMLLKSLFLHGRHIINNLEFGAERGNHYLSDIAGLFYLGIFFQDTKEGKRWLDKGISALAEEMQFQVHEDGTDFEGSISYHRLVTEIFLASTLLALKNGIAFPEWYMQRLEKMVEFVMHYTKPDGSAPQIGDSDDGRLHILSNYGNWNRLDHRYLLSTGAVIFHRPDFKKWAGTFHEESFWLLWDEMEKFQSIPDAEQALQSRAFTDGGFYIMRRGDLHMIVDCNPVNKKTPTGHRHNSRLSFELFAGDRSFIIDPGSYIYTADKKMRNLFRSTSYHNTATVDEQEQNRFEENELFSMQRDAQVKINSWFASQDHDLLDAEHNGYSRLEKPVTHRRRIYFNKDGGYWIIKDIFTGYGSHKVELFFHLAPMEIKEQDLMIQTNNKNSFNILILPQERDGLNMEIQKGYVSCSYGKKATAPVIRYSKDITTPSSFTTVIYPFKEDINIIDINEKIKSDLIGLPDVLG